MYPRRVNSLVSRESIAPNRFSKFDREIIRFVELNSIFVPLGPYMDHIYGHNMDQNMIRKKFENFFYDPFKPK